MAFVAASNGAFNGPGSISKPSGTQQGDVLVAFAVTDDGAPPTWPSGWTQIGSAVGALLLTEVRVKPVGASEPSSYSFSGSALTTVVIAAYRDVNTESPVDTHAFAPEVLAQNISAPPVTIAGQNQTVLVLGAHYSTAAELTTPAGTTSRSVRAVTSYGYRLADFTQASGTTPARQFQYPPGNTRMQAVTVALRNSNQPPNAPTLAAPATGAGIDRTSTQRFDWDFSDPDAGDSQSKYDLRHRLVGAATWTEVSGTTPNTFHDFAAGTFSEGDYEWQVRAYDAQGAVGPYSASSFFTAATAPAAPTITAPINGATVSQSELVEWSTPSQDSYQLRVLDGATPVYDSGEVVSATARSQTVAYPDNGTTRITQVRVKDGGLWSQYAEVTNTVSWLAPTVPVVSLLADDEAGSLVVTITNPAPTGDQPSTSYNDVFIDDGDGKGFTTRFGSRMIPPNTSYVYDLPRSGRDYTGSIRVEAVADNGIRSSS